MPCCATTCCIGTTIKADTLGLFYRAFSAVPTWLGGKGNAKVDPWTKQLLVAQEQEGLVNAGMCESAALAKAQKDVQASLQLNKACPCNCNCSCWEDLAIWIAVGVVALIVVLIFTNAAAKAWFKNG